MRPTMTLLFHRRHQKSWFKVCTLFHIKYSFFYVFYCNTGKSNENEQSPTTFRFIASSSNSCSLELDETNYGYPKKNFFNLHYTLNPFNVKRIVLNQALQQRGERIRNRRIVLFPILGGKRQQASEPVLLLITAVVWTMMLTMVQSYLKIWSFSHVALVRFIFSYV